MPHLDVMSKVFAIILGICFVALGSATLLLSSGPDFPIIRGSLFMVVGIACFFYRELQGKRKIDEDETS